MCSNTCTVEYFEIFINHANLFLNFAKFEGGMVYSFSLLLESCKHLVQHYPCTRGVYQLEDDSNYPKRLPGLKRIWSCDTHLLSIKNVEGLIFTYETCIPEKKVKT